MLELYNKIIDFRSVFHEGNKYYPQVFLDSCLYKFSQYDLIDKSEGITEITGTFLK